MLKEEVRETLVKTQGSLEQLEMIDSLQRLGISYHYKHEIHDILKRIYEQHHEIGRESPDLHATALGFFLLRQHSFDVSQGYYILPKSLYCNNSKGRFEVFWGLSDNFFKKDFQ